MEDNREAWRRLVVWSMMLAGCAGFWLAVGLGIAWLLGWRR